MADKTAIAKPKPAGPAVKAARPKLSQLDRQRVANLAGMTQTLKGIVEAIKSGNKEREAAMKSFLGVQLELDEQLTAIAALDDKPAEATTAQSDNL